MGDKNYELTNHLGNVLSTVTDRKIPINNGGQIDGYQADISSATQYYPFGYPIAQYPANNSYRYGFNGQEKDDEITGVQGSHYTAQFWEYDARIGRRWNVDPKSKTPISPFSVFDLNPIANTDNDGDSTVYFMDGEVIAVSHDKLGNGIVNLTYSSDVERTQILNTFASHQYDGSINSNKVNRDLRKFGVLYSVRQLDKLQRLSEKRSQESGSLKEATANIYSSPIGGQRRMIIGFDIRYSLTRKNAEYPRDESELGELSGWAHSHAIPFMYGGTYNFSYPWDTQRASGYSDYSIATDDRYFHFYGPGLSPISLPRKYLFNKVIIGRMQELRGKLGTEANDQLRGATQSSSVEELLNITTK